MDRTEALAREHLVFRGFTDIVYEPDGNVPPDFLVDGRIAVEVRRLNQSEHGCSAPRGLEQTEIPLMHHLERLLASYGLADSTRWMALRFHRPLPDWSVIEAGARQFLARVALGQVPAESPQHVALNVELEYIGVTAGAGQLFELGVTSDLDSGGWVLPELERNLRLCVEEKTRKVKPHRCRYPEWWLLFVDTVAYGLSDRDRATFRRTVELVHDWDRIIMVSPINSQHYFEL